MKTVIEMAREAGFSEPNPHDGYMGLAFDYRTGTDTGASIEHFAELVRADERRRITNLMLYMHNKASPYHNYYKHAAVEINRKAGEGEKI